MARTTPRSSHLRPAPASTACALLLAACAQTTGEIDRTQPDGLEKSLFRGEWYYRTTVSDAPFTSGYTFVGDQGPLHRVVWDIEERTLFAYRSYEQVHNAEAVGFRQDADVGGIDGEVRYFGDPIAAFPIVAHFDVQRSYSATTGEPGNVLVENASDRPWYERGWMRVDWRRNLASFNGFTLTHEQVRPLVVAAEWDGELGEGQDPATAPVFEEDRIDLSTRYHLTPPTIYFEGFGEIPLCYLVPFFTGALFDCQPEVIGVRHSFSRVTADDYVARAYDDLQMDRFGLFRTERLHYDKERGLTDAGRIHYANRFPLWVDEAGCVDPGAERPHAACRARTIRYHLSRDFPLGAPGAAADLIDPVEFLHRYGRDALSRAVDLDALVRAKGARSLDDIVDLGRMAAAFGFASLASTAELDLTHLDDRALAASVAIEGLDLHVPGDVAALRQALLKGLGLDGVLGADSTFADLESVEDASFRLIAEWNEAFRATVAGATGRAPADVDDVLVLCHNPAREGDHARCFDAEAAPSTVKENGDLRWSFLYWVPVPNQVGLGGFGPMSADPLSGRTVSASAYVYGGNLRASAATHADRVLVQAGIRTEDEVTGSGRHVKREVAGRAGYTAEESRALAASVITPSVRRRLEEGGVPTTDHDFAAARLRRLEALPEIEALVTPPDVRVSFADPRIDPRAAGDALLDDQRARMAPRAWLHRSGRPEARRRMRDLQERNLYFTAYIDGALEGYASRFARAWETVDAQVGADPERREIAKGAFHEWVKYELLTDIYRAIAAHEVGHNLGLRHNFEASSDALNFNPGYWDLRGADGRPGEALSDAQAEGGMLEHAYSSIMDYHGRVNADFQGIGLYDRAAIKYAYGDLVEVFATAPGGSGKADLAAARGGEADARRGNVALERALRQLHYTRLPGEFGGVAGMFDRVDVPAPALAQDSSLVEVPYRFCSDDYAGASPTCLRFDLGADEWEVVHNAAVAYEAYRPFYASSLDRMTFQWVDGWRDRLLDQFFWPMRAQFDHWVLQMARNNDGGAWARNHDGLRWEEDPDGGLAGTLAAAELLNLIGRVLGRPEPNTRYCRDDATGQYRTARDGDGGIDRRSCRAVTADDGAIDLYNEFDYSSYQYKVVHMGSIYDRMAALAALTDPTVVRLLGEDLGAGGGPGAGRYRRYLINLQTVFPRQTLDLVSGLVLDDPARFGWVMADDGPRPRRLAGTAEQVATDAGLPAINPYGDYLFPTTRYRIPALAAYYGMALLTGSYSQSFVDATRVYLQGSAAEIDPDVPAGQVAVYTDPTNGRTYEAYRLSTEDDAAGAGGDGDGPSDAPPSVAWELVRRARELADAYRTDAELRDDYNHSELQYVVGKLDLLRTLHQAYGEGLARP